LAANFTALNAYHRNLALLGPIAAFHFTVPRRVEGWVTLRRGAAWRKQNEKNTRRWRTLPTSFSWNASMRSAIRLCCEMEATRCASNIVRLRTCLSAPRNIRTRAHSSCTVHKQPHTVRQFTFSISRSLRPKTETKPLNFGLSPMLSLTNHSHASSLKLSAIHRWFRRISLFIFESVTKWSDFRSWILNL